MAEPPQQPAGPISEPVQSRLFYGAEVPFADLCGIEALDVVDGQTRLRLTLGREHTNNLGIAHGGIICTLLDLAMGTAARLHAQRSVLTLDLQARFLNPGRGVLLVEGRVVRGGRSILFCEAAVMEDSGALIATATGILKPVPQP